MDAISQTDYLLGSVPRAILSALLLFALGCASSPWIRDTQNVRSGAFSSSAPVIEFGGEESKDGIFVYVDEPVEDAKSGQNQTIVFRIWNALDRPVLLRIEPAIVFQSWAELRVNGYMSTANDGQVVRMGSPLDVQEFVLLNPSPVIRGMPAKYINSFHTTFYVVNVPEVEEPGDFYVKFSVSIKCYVVGSNDLVSERLTYHFHTPVWPVGSEDSAGVGERR